MSNSKSATAPPVIYALPICPSCRGRHIAVEFRPLNHVRPGGATHGGHCPVTGAKVMLTPKKKN